MIIDLSKTYLEREIALKQEVAKKEPKKEVMWFSPVHVPQNWQIVSSKTRNAPLKSWQSADDEELKRIVFYKSPKEIYNQIPDPVKKMVIEGKTVPRMTQSTDVSSLLEKWSWLFANLETKTQTNNVENSESTGTITSNHYSSTFWIDLNGPES